MDLPKVGSEWRGDSWGDGDFCYTIIGVTNLGSTKEEYQPQIVYRGSDGVWWSKNLAQWPGSLVQVPPLAIPMRSTNDS